MESPIVSVIIPTYNRAEYLKQAITSVLAQTYTNFELLILDNYSTDLTPDVVASFNDPRIKYLRHQCNIRSMANWSYGVYWAQGEYLCILGDDDWYTPEFICSRVEAFNKYENLAAVFSNYDICDQNGSSDKIIHTNNYNQEKVFSGNELINIIVNYEWFIGATLYKREIVVNLFEKSLMAGKAGDNALNINIALTPNTNIARICEKGLIYRRHSQQDSIQDARMLLVGSILAWKLPLQFEEHNENKRTLEKAAGKIYNRLGRIMWNSGQKKWQENIS